MAAAVGMDNPAPRVQICDGQLVIHLSNAVGLRVVPFDCMLDRACFGDPVGVEILDLKGQLGAAVTLPTQRDNVLRWSYDEEIDALYVRLSGHGSHGQRRVTGTARLDGWGCLVSLQIPMAA
jgi:hypothetical protein